MAALPSYQHAIARPDWLPIVAPYVYTTDIPRLCRVSKRFNDHFRHFLWNDPLGVACALKIPAFRGEEELVCRQPSCNTK